MPASDTRRSLDRKKQKALKCHAYYDGLLIKHTLFTFAHGLLGNRIIPGTADDPLTIRCVRADLRSNTKLLHFFQLWTGRAERADAGLIVDRASIALCKTKTNR